MGGAAVGWRARVLWTCAALVVACRPAAGADSAWPRWRGPRGDGRVTGEVCDVSKLSGFTEPLWELDIGRGFSSVVVGGGRLYTLGNDGERDTVYCLDAATGEEHWRHSYACEPGRYPGPRSTPLLDGAAVYTFSRAGDLFCFRAEDGKVLWRQSVRSRWKLNPPRWGFACSPVVDGEKLVLNAGRHGLVLNKSTGAQIWSSGPGGCSYATPVFYDAGGERCVAIFAARSVYGVVLSSGAVRWSHQWKTRYDVNAADPIVTDGRVFISSGYGKGGALLDITQREPNVLWRRDTMGNHFSTCVLMDGYLYGIDGNAGRGSLRCVELESGWERWSKSTGFGSLIAVDRTLLVLNERGTLFAVAAEPGAYKELASARVVKRPKCWSPPVLVAGRLYCRSNSGALVCVDLR